MTTIREILAFLSDAEVIRLAEDVDDAEISGPSVLPDAHPEHVTFSKSGQKAASLLAETHAGLVIAARTNVVPPKLLADNGVRCLALVDNPRLEFVRVIERFFAPARPSGVHPTAVLAPQAALDVDVYVGPGASVGASKVGEGSIIHAGARILDGVRIGKRVVVHPNAVIGSEGFGFERDEDGVPRRFTHLGGVVIGDDAEVGGATCVDRGTLGDTVIEERAKIDNLVHIAHNVRVGRDTMVAANAVIAGSAKLGERVWVGPSAVVSNGITVGDDASVSLGAVVTKDVGPGERVTGNFAIPHERFIKNLKNAR